MKFYNLDSVKKKKFYNLDSNIFYNHRRETPTMLQFESNSKKFVRLIIVFPVIMVNSLPLIDITFSIIVKEKQ
jgi:hypothetical protein